MPEHPRTPPAPLRLDSTARKKPDSKSEQTGNRQLNANKPGPLHPQGPENLSFEVSDLSFDLGDAGLRSDIVLEGLGQCINKGLGLAGFPCLQLQVC